MNFRCIYRKHVFGVLEDKHETKKWGQKITKSVRKWLVKNNTIM